MKKKIIFQRSYDNYFNIKLSLEQNLLDIRSMESSNNIHNVLKEAAKATQGLKININDFENVAEKMRDNNENMKEVYDIIGDFNNDAMNNEELDKELIALQIAEEKADKLILKEEQKKAAKGISTLFPSVNSKKNIISNKDKNKDNFMNDNKFQDI